MKFVYISFLITSLSCFGSELYFDPKQQFHIQKTFTPNSDEEIVSAAISDNGKNVVIGTNKGSTILFYPLKGDKESTTILKADSVKKQSDNSSLWVGVSNDGNSVLAVQGTLINQRSTESIEKNEKKEESATSEKIESQATDEKVLTDTKNFLNDEKSYSTLFLWKTISRKNAIFEEPYVFNFIDPSAKPIFSANSQLVTFPHVSYDKENIGKFILSELKVFNLNDLRIEYSKMSLLHEKRLDDAIIAPIMLFENGLNELVSGNAPSLKTNFILALGNRNTAHLFDLVSQRESSLSPYHSGWITAAAFNHDDTVLATGSDDTTLRLWDLEKHLDINVDKKGRKASPPFLKELKGHKETITKLLFNKKGTSLISADLIGKINIWNPANGLLQKTVQSKAKRPITHLSLTTDGRYLLTVDVDGNFEIWDTSKQISLYSNSLKLFNQEATYWQQQSYFSFHKNQNVFAAKIVDDGTIILVTKQKVIIGKLTDEENDPYFDQVDYLG